MTLDELARTLPNGFHDAEVTTVTIDYERHELLLRMRVWLGGVDSPDSELYRTAVVTLSGLLFCVIEPPNPRYPYRDAGALTIDTGTVESLPSPPETDLPDQTPEGAFTNWIFVGEWNSFIYASAIEAGLVWVDEPGSPEPE
jgi:hypothetical protein